VTLPLPEIEGKYEVLEKLQEGGMGAIYKVRHRLLGEVRVIKVIRPHLEGDEELKARFLREARLGIKLRHPNIAQLYDFTLDDAGTAYMVLEYIDGHTLQGMVKRVGPLPVALTLEIARQALRALSCLHGQGFVHRDIAPDNLMLTRDVEGKPQVKMIDLGIAKGLQGEAEVGLTATGMFLGKIRYAAPEQLQGGNLVDGRADLYAFGVVLYELLTGQYPISGDSPPSIIAGHLFSEPLDFAESDPQGTLPEPLREIILRCLVKKPEERFADAQELADALAEVQRRYPWDDGMFQHLLDALETGATLSFQRSTLGTTARRLEEQFPPVPTPARTVVPTLATALTTPTPAPVPTPLPVPLPTPLPPSTAPGPPPVAASSGVGKTGLALGVLAAVGLVVIVLLGVVGGFYFLRSSPTPGEEDPPEARAPAVVGEGRVLLNALPWGEVRAIIDGQGEDHPLPAVPYTPLSLTLPAGSYRLTLRHPDRVASEVVEIEVAADRAVRSVVPLHTPRWELVTGQDTPGPLQAAAAAYLAGDYARVVRTLGDEALPADRRFAAAAYLLRAAARHALYLEGGERDLALLESARQDVRASKERQRDLTVPGSVFSPRFVAFFASV